MQERLDCEACLLAHARLAQISREVVLQHVQIMEAYLAIREQGSSVAEPETDASDSNLVGFKIYTASAVDSSAARGSGGAGTVSALATPDRSGGTHPGVDGPPLGASRGAGSPGARVTGGGVSGSMGDAASSAPPSGGADPGGQ